jgi:DNA-binding response OmpR family regulator
MAFVSHAQLTRLLLQRSDRHPPGCIDGSDLGSIDPAAVNWFIRLRLLVEREQPTEADGGILQNVGDRWVSASADGEVETRPIDANALKQFDIDLLELCRQLRGANGWHGSPVERFGPRAFWLGAIGTGSRRRAFVLVRAMRDENAIDTALAVRGRADVGSVVILTPTERNLSTGVAKRLAAERVQVLPIAEMVDENAAEPLALRIPPAVNSTADVGGEERLVVDVQGGRAWFDGKEVDVRAREFAVLTLLAIELTDQDGFVTRDAIYAGLRSATGSENVQEEQIEKSVSLVRAALAKACGMTRQQGGSLIKVKRRVGYRLDLPSASVRVY